MHHNSHPSRKGRHAKRHHTKGRHTKGRHAKRHHTKGRHTKGRHAKRHHTKGRHTKHKLSTRGSLRRRSKSGGNVDYKFSGLLLQSKKLVQNTGFGF
jgi:hypothetical protein